jgi:glyceraldehyde-3-phosphate dehydrogenase/erythrose-4-phosphate dehydrogenase
MKPLARYFCASENAKRQGKEHATINPMTNIAINGAGRIGRAFLKLAIQNPKLKVVAINDLADIENIAYLMKYDSAYGRSNLDISVDKAASTFTINGQVVKYVSEKDPANLPWAAHNVDIVLESTGLLKLGQNELCFQLLQKKMEHLSFLEQQFLWVLTSKCLQIKVFV